MHQGRARRDKPRVRLYQQIRSAHLERALQLPPATILYANRRADFDPSLAAGLDLVQVGSWRAAWFLTRHEVGVLEVNEPLMAQSARRTALALLALAVRRALGRPRTVVVAYAIENLAAPPPEPGRGVRGVRARLGGRLDKGLMRCIWRRLDRVAFGTAAARNTYRRCLPQTGHVPASILVPALPAASASCCSADKDPDTVIFLGELAERKGFPLLARAWPLVLAVRPHTSLVLVGSGALEPVAENLVANHPRVQHHPSPTRSEIRSLLARSAVLVLPSQPRPRWREQVGLPITEGLSSGCTVVTTTETGLAGWLADHGHRVVPADVTPNGLAGALVSALSEPLPVREVLASLPAEDGRLAADAWLFDDRPARASAVRPRVGLQRG